MGKQQKTVKEKQQATTAADDFLSGQKKDPTGSEEKTTTSKEDAVEKGDAQVITPSMMEEFREMMQKMQSTIDKQADEIKALKSAPVQHDEDQVNEFDIDDYLEVPAVFYAFSTYYSLFGDQRYGKTVYTPSGKPVRFEKAYRWQRNSATGGRGTETVSICQATVRSKTEAEWLRKHSLFNIRFFENLKEAATVDTMLAEKMVWANNMVSSMNDYVVIERAKVEQTLISPDILVTRRVLIEHLAKKALAQERDRQAAKTRSLLRSEENVQEAEVSEDRASMIAKDAAVE